MVELVGYLGSALVVMSLLMTRILRLRVIGLLGATTFVIYGLLIGSLPIVITNATIMVINITFLWRATRVTEWFHLLEVQPTSSYLGDFLRFYRDDIAESQPEWTGDVHDGDITLFVLRDMQPAMAIVGSIGGATMDLRLDYAIPRFRDYRMGRFLYDSSADFFLDRGITTIVSSGQTKAHAGYLRKMGFTETQPGHFERSLTGRTSAPA
jgi:hypothetical protein